MEVREAFSLIARAIDSDTAANGYVIVGGLDRRIVTRGPEDREKACVVAVHGNASELARLILHRLFPDSHAQIEENSHPDVVWLEPEGKSRTIHVKTMRENLIEPMGVTSFSGGWKVGLIVGADRMEVAAANAFLKSLEEPTPKTMYLLLTDAPDAVLPTVISRCQRIDLKLPSDELSGKPYEEIAEIFSSDIGAGVFEKAQAGKRLAEILGKLKEESVDEDVAMVRKSFYRTVMGFVRNWMVEGFLPRYQAFRNVEAVEDAARQSDRAMNDEAVLTFLTDRLVFPTKR